jgi:hypothetical protein
MSGSPTARPVRREPADPVLARAVARTSARLGSLARVMHREAAKPGAGLKPAPTEALAPWEGLRSPDSYSCPNCAREATPDPTGGLAVIHEWTCPARRESR